MGAASLAETVAEVRERSAEYLRSAEAATLPDDLGLWPGDTNLRRLLQRLGILRGPSPTKPNRRRMAAVHRILAARGATGEAFLDALADYCAPEGAKAVCLATPRCAECDLQAACAHYAKRPTIKDMPAAQRPRERLLAKGVDALSDAELLALIIRDGTPQVSAVDLAQQLLKQYGDLPHLAQASPHDLIGNKSLKGIGPAKAAQISAAMCLARRYHGISFERGEAFRSSRQIFEFYQHRLGVLEEERFVTMFLDVKNRLIAEQETSRGGLTGSGVDPRVIFKDALRNAACGVIFVHNHPSGDPAPSADDRQITARLKEAGVVLGLRVLDHIIVGQERFFSFADEGIL